MRNKTLITTGLIITLGLTSIAADAGTTRSGASGRSFGGRAGNHSISFGHIGHVGGSATVNRDADKTSVTVTTKRGGSFAAANANGVTVYAGASHRGGAFSGQGENHSFTTTGKTANGLIYNGSGHVNQETFYTDGTDGELHEGTMTTIDHSGTLSGNNRSVSVGGHLEADVTTDPSSHSRYSSSHGVQGDTNFHSSGTTIQKENSGSSISASHYQATDVTGKNGNNLYIYTGSGVDNVNGTISFTAPHAYELLYNGQPIG